MNTSRIDELLDRWEDLRERGEDVTIDDLCGDDPDLRFELQSSIQALEKVAWMDKLDVPDSDCEAFGAESTGAAALPKTSLTVDEFAKSVCERGLLSEDELQSFRDGLPDDGDSNSDARSLAGMFVSHGKLTAYQASIVLEARNDPLLIDRYVILDALGVGGMGIVFKALHKSMDRIVALKLLPNHAVDSPDKVERFQREARATAKLSHPNIVTVFDAAEAHGAHFLAMEYVTGPDLASVLEQSGPLPVAQAVQLIHDAALGLQHAHERGIIHRDIKPGNLLIGQDSTVKVADLGLATIETGAPAEHASQELTQNGCILGTIAFLSPEQALEARLTDPRSDIYSLGATLFCLLTGRAPYNEDTAMKTLVAHREAAIPSLRESRPDVPEDLDAICTRMLAKRPQDRFDSMADVATALDALEVKHPAERISGAAPTAATADTSPITGSFDRTREWQPSTSTSSVSYKDGSVKRRLLATALGAAVLLSGIVIVIRNRDGSERRVDVGDAKSVTIKAGDREIEVDLDGARPVTTSLSPKIAADLWKPGPADEILPGLVTSPAKIPGIRRWQMGMRNCGEPINSLAWHPDGRLVACASSHGDVRLLDADSLEFVRYLPGHGHKVTCVTWSRDGLLASSSRDGTIRISNGEGMQGPVLQGHSAYVNSVAWSHSGEWLASAGDRGTVRLWARDGTEGPVLDGHSAAATCVAWSPDDQLVASAGRDGRILIWHHDGTPGRVITDERGSIGRLLWIDDEQIAATAKNSIRVWSTDGTPGAVFEGHTQHIFDLALSPGGRQVATASWDRTLRLWLPDGSSQFVIRAPNMLRAIAWSPDGRRVVSYCDDRRLRVHSATGRLLKKDDPDDSLWPRAVAVSPDGVQVASGHRNGLIRLIDADGSQRAALTEHRGRIESIDWSPDGSHFASGSSDSTVRIWKNDGASVTALNDHSGTVLGVAWSPDGQWLATASNDKSVRLWRPDGAAGPVFHQHTDSVYAVAWSPDSRQIVSASLDGTARLWNVDGTEGPVVARSGRRLLAVDWSPGGKQIATGSTEGSVLLYPPLIGSDPKPLSLNPGTTTYCYAVEWNHDGSLLASGHGDMRLRFWEPDGAPAGELRTRGELIALNWSADGQRLVTASAHRTVTLWDVESRQPLWSTVPLSDDQFATLSPDGRILNGDPDAIENELVYIVEQDDGRLETLTPSAFAAATREDNVVTDR